MRGTYSEESQNASGSNVASIGMGDPRRFGARDRMDALAVRDNQIWQVIDDLNACVSASLWASLFN